MFEISPSMSAILTLPATFATAFGFIWSYGKMLHAMAESKLLPDVFVLETKSKSPYVCYLFGSIIGIALCAVLDWSDYLYLSIFPLCLLFALTAYIAQCIGYLFVKHKLNAVQTPFRSPFGEAGAYFSIFVWILAFISVIAFQADQFAIIAYACIVSLLTVYYYGYAKTRQTFSEDERKILFTAHVSNCKNVCHYFILNIFITYACICVC